MRALVVLTVLISGCVSESNVLERVAASGCRRDRECNQADFESTWEDLEECVTSGVDALDDWQACAIEAGCTYSPEEADGCLEAIRQETCEAFNAGEHTDECDSIYTCTGGQLFDVGVCLLGS